MKGLPRPLWAGKGVTLYHADARDIVPRFEERGHCIVDFEYSEHVHEERQDTPVPSSGAP